MAKKFYITTAIPYVNAAPHIGFALEVIQADVIARYHRLLGKDVRFLAGTDENALKNVQAAKEQGVEVKKLVDQNAKKFYSLKEVLNLSYDDFIRTTEKRHIEGVQKLWLSCKKEDIYKKNYQGLYCLDCEAFLTEKDLVNGQCPEHKKEPELVKEENYFFRLSKYQDWLEKIIESNQLKITPEIRKNEILAFIRQGLEDLSISRTRKRAHGWGIPVPGDPSQNIYINALKWYKNSPLFKKYWPADVHVIGKGISRFHAVYWPAFLKSAGIALPKQEFIHGYVTVEGQKLSKSLGNIVDPFKIVKKFGVDPTRYYLLREIPSYGDGDFSRKRFREVYNADLANGLGNLVARVAKLCQNSDFSFPFNKPIFCRRYQKYLEDYRFEKALARVWQFITQTDQKINQEKVWEQKDKKLHQSLQSLVKSIRKISFHLKPFLPETAEKIEKQFAGPKIKSEKPLFPRL